MKREASRIEFLRANGAPLMAADGRTAHLTSPARKGFTIHPPAALRSLSTARPPGGDCGWAAFKGNRFSARSAYGEREKESRGTCLGPLCSLARSLAPALAVQLGHECARALSRYPCSHPARVLEAAAVVAALRAVSRAVSRQ